MPPDLSQEVAGLMVRAIMARSPGANPRDPIAGGIRQYATFMGYTTTDLVEAKEGTPAEEALRVLRYTYGGPEKVTRVTYDARTDLYQVDYDTGRRRTFSPAVLDPRIAGPDERAVQDWLMCKGEHAPLTNVRYGSTVLRPESAVTISAPSRRRERDHVEVALDLEVSGEIGRSEVGGVMACLGAIGAVASFVFVPHAPLGPILFAASFMVGLGGFTMWGLSPRERVQETLAERLAAPRKPPERTREIVYRGFSGRETRGLKSLRSRRS